VGFWIFGRRRPRTFDPVCGMEVEARNAPFRLEHAGQTFTFCTANCMGKFKAEPVRYAR